jgi:hypothetical protein
MYCRGKTPMEEEEEEEVSEEEEEEEVSLSVLPELICCEDVDKDPNVKDSVRLDIYYLKNNLKITNVFFAVGDVVSTNVNYMYYDCVQVDYSLVAEVTMDETYDPVWKPVVSGAIMA